MCNLKLLWTTASPFVRHWSKTKGRTKPDAKSPYVSSFWWRLCLRWQLEISEDVWLGVDIYRDGNIAEKWRFVDLEEIGIWEFECLYWLYSTLHTQFEPNLVDVLRFNLTMFVILPSVSVTFYNIKCNTAVFFLLLVNFQLFHVIFTPLCWKAQQSVESLHLQVVLNIQMQ